jgi:uncharacterized protein (TIGR04255 family)
MGEMPRTYKNPPIVEVLCEFQFIPTQPWDFTIPGVIYDKIKTEFPLKKQQFGIGVQFKPTEKGGLEHRVENAPPRVQFFNEDRTKLVQVGPDLFVVNQLKPYESWDSFRPLILEKLGIYKDVSMPKGFKRIGLRYINKINIISGVVTLENLKNYLNIYMNVPSSVPQNHQSYLLRTEIPYNDSRDQLILTVGSTIPDELTSSSIIFDLDYFLAKSDSIQFVDIEGWLENSHSEIERIFEACITDKSREIFGEEET